MDCQQTLPFGTTEDVARDVDNHIHVFATGGGYVFAPMHNIQAGIPPAS
jgi:uroporphyrinogen decarboxylase